MATIQIMDYDVASDGESVDVTVQTNFSIAETGAFGVNAISSGSTLDETVKNFKNPGEMVVTLDISDGDAGDEVSVTATLTSPEVRSDNITFDIPGSKDPDFTGSLGAIDADEGQVVADYSVSGLPDGNFYEYRFGLTRGVSELDSQNKTGYGASDSGTVRLTHNVSPGETVPLTVSMAPVTPSGANAPDAGDSVTIDVTVDDTSDGSDGGDTDPDPDPGDDPDPEPSPDPDPGDDPEPANVSVSCSLPNDTFSPGDTIEVQLDIENSGGTSAVVEVTGYLGGQAISSLDGTPFSIGAYKTQTYSRFATAPDVSGTQELDVTLDYTVQS